MFARYKVWFLQADSKYPTDRDMDSWVKDRTYVDLTEAMASARRLALAGKVKVEDLTDGSRVVWSN